jgi:hypothetical protein
MSLLTLPTELLHEIDSHLAYKAHVALSWTCKKLHRVLPRRRPPGWREWIKTPANQGDQNPIYETLMFTFDLNRCQRFLHFYGNVQSSYTCPACLRSGLTDSDVWKPFFSNQQRDFSHPNSFLLAPLSRRWSTRFKLVLEDERVRFRGECHRGSHFWNVEGDLRWMVIMCGDCKKATLPHSTRVGLRLLEKSWK